MHRDKLKVELIKDKLMTSKQKLTVIRPDFGQAAMVFVGKKLVGTATFDGRQYYFKANYGMGKPNNRKQCNFGDKFKR